MLCNFSIFRLSTRSCAVHLQVQRIKGKAKRDKKQERKRKQLRKKTLNKKKHLLSICGCYYLPK